MRYRLLAVVLWFVFGVEGPAFADDTRPQWLHAPSAANVKLVWPTEALKRGIGGKTVLQCGVSIRGAVFDCVVLSEDPAGLFFGQAALAMTPQFVFKPATHDGQPVISTVTIPITFPGRTLDQAATGSRIPGGGAGGQPIASTANAIANSGAQAVVAGIQWIKAPSYSDMAAAYPAAARAQRVSGRVTLSCRLGRTGAVTDCDTISEEPLGYGFGSAAKSLALGFAAAVDPKAPPTRVTTELPITFDPQTLSEPPVLIGKPKWTHLPASLDFDQSFPAAAAAVHVGAGNVTLRCVVDPSGGLSGCRIASAAPEGLGFGEAALSMSKLIRVSLWTDEGFPTAGGEITVPIRYEAAASGGPGAQDASVSPAVAIQEGLKAARQHDYAAAVSWYRIGVAAGDARSEERLGEAYWEGLGVGADLVQAFRLLKTAADQGQPYAEADLGLMYLSGLGVRRNRLQAVVWLSKAAAQGMPTTMDWIHDHPGLLKDDPAHALYDTALESMDQGRADDAIKQQTEAIAAGQDDPPFLGEAYCARAQAYEKKGLNDQALADDAHAVTVDPTTFSYNARAWNLHILKRDADGLPDAELAVRLARPNSEDLADAVETRAEIYERLGRRDEALADYRAALKSDPDMKEAIAGLKRLGAAY